MDRYLLVLCMAVAALALGLPGAHAAEPVLPEAEKCAPPCGYIMPTISIRPELEKSDLLTSKIGELPTTVPVHIGYSWDMEQEGTGAPGSADPMKITILISKKPTWLSAQIAPATCTFMLVPVQNEYEVCTVELTLKVYPEYVPTTEESLDVVGKRLMLFATSEESGMFKKSYGVKDLRWNWDDVPAVEGAPVMPKTSDEEAAPAVAPAVLVIGLAALLGVARRRH